MYVAIRKYRSEGSAEAVEEAVRRELVPVLKQDRGFRGFYMIDGGDGVIASVSVFDSEQAAQRSNEQAVAARSKFLHLLPNDPEIVVGEAGIAETA
jgi:heme-degrading monooxygenase HmoA